jgi:hypothetical protein
MSALRDKFKRAAGAVPTLQKVMHGRLDQYLERVAIIEQKAVNEFEAANQRLTMDVEKGIDEIDGELNLIDNGGPSLG